MDSLLPFYNHNLHADLLLCVIGVLFARPANLFRLCLFCDDPNDISGIQTYADAVMCACVARAAVAAGQDSNCNKFQSKCHKFALALRARNIV